MSASSFSSELAWGKCSKRLHMKIVQVEFFRLYLAKVLIHRRILPYSVCTGSRQYSIIRFEEPLLNRGFFFSLQPGVIEPDLVIA
jgi:hypothetical protein